MGPVAGAFPCGDKNGPVAELKNSAAGFFLPTEIIKKENTVKSEGVSAKTSATNQTQAGQSPILCKHHLRCE